MQNLEISLFLQFFSSNQPKIRTSMFIKILATSYLNLFCARDVHSGAVLARSSQPEVGLLGWRCNEDEKLLSSIARSALLNSWAHIPIGMYLTS